MMRVDVDFNERDRQGRVVARVPGAQVPRLGPGRRLYLYDPPEKLWADAVVASVDPDTRIATFDVDWRSFVDAEVADFRDAQGEWSIGVAPVAQTNLPRYVCAFSSTAKSAAMLKISVETIFPAGTVVVEPSWQLSSTTGAHDDGMMLR
jgi:hypothetical protein